MKQTQQPGHCPKCNSNNLEYEDTQLEDTCIGYKFQCLDCEFEGIEWYDLAFTVFTDQSTGEEIRDDKGGMDINKAIDILQTKYNASVGDLTEWKWNVVSEIDGDPEGTFFRNDLELIEYVKELEFDSKEEKQ